MKRNLFFILLAATTCSQAGTSKDVITIPKAVTPWSFGAGYAPLIGLKANFSGLGTFNRNYTEQPLGGGQNYNYDNGFVRLDSSDNNGAATWNWSYQNPSQYDASGGGAMSYTLTNSLANADASDDGENASGIECYTYFDMGAANLPLLENSGATWGFRGGLHYAHVNIHNNSALGAGTFILTDRFNLGGVMPPNAPYTGSFAGPGPLIGDSPDRSTAEGLAALVAGSRDLDVDLTTLSFGSYLEIPIYRQFSVSLEGGINAAIASGSYEFDSATTIAGLGTRASSGSDSDTRILPGAYLGLSAIYQINPQWAIQASGRYQYLNDFTLGDHGSKAELSFGSTFILSLGALYSF